MKLMRNVKALDLHVLGTPPAFILSQDQTLHKSGIATAKILSNETQIRTDAPSVKQTDMICTTQFSMSA